MFHTHGLFAISLAALVKLVQQSYRIECHVVAKTQRFCNPPVFEIVGGLFPQNFLRSFCVTELLMGLEPMTSSLPRKCSTTELQQPM